MESVFTAVADPTRRVLLDRLRCGGPQSITALATGLPMTRQAVTKHLDALVDSRLVDSYRAGRSRLHRLNAAPLKELEAWLQPYADFWDERLERLARHLEEKP